jgi:hypothetical protein
MQLKNQHIYLIKKTIKLYVYVYIFKNICHNSLEIISLHIKKKIKNKSNIRKIIILSQQKNFFI